MYDYPLCEAVTRNYLDTGAVVITIPMIPSDITDGCRFNSRRCAVALAVSRHFGITVGARQRDGSPMVVVYPEYIVVGDKWYDPTDATVSIIVAFDNRQLVWSEKLVVELH